jgi:hypothetical protein
MTKIRGVPRLKGSNDTPLSVNLPAEWVAELEALAEALSIPGAERTRADALRACIRRGLDELTREHPPKGGKKR